MIIDCDACAMEGTAACADCIVPALLAEHPGPLRLGPEERAALARLAEGGLVAPLRLVPLRSTSGPGGAATAPAWSEPAAVYPGRG